MENQPKRQTAYKVWISDLINHEFIKQEGEWDPNYIQVGNKKISRVNIIATVIEKTESEDKTYSSLIIDDGSENISVKAWREDINLLNDIQIGCPILIIGRVKEYNDKIFISPEIIKKLDNLSWIELRKKELLKEYGQPTNFEDIKITQEEPQKPKEILIAQEEVVDDLTTETDRKKILNNIEKLNSEDGTDINDLISELKIEESKVHTLIQELLKEGEIFEISPGKVKILE